MIKKGLAIIIAVLLMTLFFSGCSSKTDDTSKADEQIYNEITDIQLALLNHIVVSKDSLIDLEGRSIEGHDELIDDKFKYHIDGGESLIDQLIGYTLIDVDYGDVTGFKAAAFTKGKNLVLVYGGTDHWTDFVDDVFGGLFDFSAMDGQAKAFAKDNAKKYNHHSLYITGYSMGGRLCYLGTEAVINDSLGGNLKKVRTFNGLGVKEIFNIKDSNLSNIHYLKTLFEEKTYDYIVKGDIVSDEDAHLSLKSSIGYNHIGTEFKVPCTNEIDNGILKQHDLYSIIDYLLNNPAPAENNSTVKNLDSKPVLIISDEDHNLIGEFINVDGDTRVNTWNTFVSKYPQAADPLSQGREYFSKMHITLFFLKDNEGNVIDNKGVMNATGFGIDPCGWKDKFGEFDWMYTNTPETYEEENFYIRYEGEYFSGPADCHIINAKIREYVTLGIYEQDGKEDNGKEPIEWLVLTQDNDKMLVVSKYCLDYLTYPDDWTSNISWESSSLREYLNSDFYNNAFSFNDLQEILLTEIQNKASDNFYCTIDGNPTEDRIFLLSIDEVQTFLPASTASEQSKKAYGTNYLYSVLKEHPYYGNVQKGDPVNWALRADIDTDRNDKGFGRPREMVVYDSQIQNMLTTGGMRDPEGPLSVIRPAMWIKSSVQKHRSDSGAAYNNRSTGWSDLYRDFILDQQYLSQQTGVSIQGKDDYNVDLEKYSDYKIIYFMLYDFDQDNIPELIAYSGYSAFSTPYMYVYTVKDGQMVYLDRLGMGQLCYYPASNYKGVFYNGGRQGYYYTSYTYYESGHFITKTISSDAVIDNKDWDKGFKTTIHDEELYKAYLECTEPGQSSSAAFSRKGLYIIPFYNYSEILSMGWDEFLSKY